MTTSSSQTGAQKRPPIVVVMGHVDHGKTSLLDYVRKSRVASGEAGGITQAVAAYEIVHPSVNSGQAAGEKITFIDTPGHAAFSAMRSRGASIADLAIVVVAADEGIKPQTLEAITLLQESKTPFIIAMNKIDREDANVEKLKNDFTAAGIYLEGYGGQISYQPISAKTGEGVNELLDVVLLTAEVENLTYDPSVPASGFILEARASKHRGVEVSVILKNGTLRQGDSIGTATSSGRVKILETFLGTSTKELEPSSPAHIIGFESLPKIGEDFSCDPAVISRFVDARSAVVVSATAPAKSPLEMLMAQNKPKTFTVILKAADAGSLEALSSVVGALTAEKQIEILASSVGDIGDNDIKFATSTGAVIVGFNVKMAKAVTLLAHNSHVTVLSSDIIYKLVDQLQVLLDKGLGTNATGELEVLAVFNQKRFSKQLVGGRIARGMFRNKGSVSIYRGEAVIASGKLLSLRDVKKDIESAEAPSEVGIVVDTNTKIEVGDRIVLT